MRTAWLALKVPVMDARGLAKRVAGGGLALGCALLLHPLASRASVLSSAAAALQPGHYVEISTGLTHDDLEPDAGQANSMLDYSDSGTWDPVRHKFYFIGKESGCGGPFRLIIYDEASNSWSYGSVPVSTGCGHGYDGNSTDPVTGAYYFHPYGNQVVYKMNTSNGSWSSVSPAIQANITIVGGVAKGKKGLLYSESQWDIWWDDATGQKSEVQSSIHTGGYQNVAEYDPIHDQFLVGSGSGSTTMCKVTIVNGSPVRTQLHDAPFIVGPGEGDERANVTADPVTGKFVIYQRSSGNFYQYDLQTDSAYQLIGRSGDGNFPPLPTGYSTGPIAAPINSYGVIMYVAQNGTAAHVYLYKHASSGPADLTAPAPPSQLIAR